MLNPEVKVGKFTSEELELLKRCILVFGENYDLFRRYFSRTRLRIQKESNRLMGKESNFDNSLDEDSVKDFSDEDSVENLSKKTKKVAKEKKVAKITSKKIAKEIIITTTEEEVTSETLVKTKEIHQVYRVIH